MKNHDGSTQRSFHPVFCEICKLLPKKLANKLREKIDYWAPETYWWKLSVFINDNITPSASDENSVKIYALLCDISEEEMRKEFIKNGNT